MSAWWDGMRRVNRAPAILAGVWTLTLLFSLPPALAVRGLLAGHLGSSLAAETAASGVDYDWMQEFAAQASGLGATVRPEITGFGGVLGNWSAFLDNAPRPAAVAAAAAAYVVLWVFLTGGIIDRYARDRGRGAYGFVSTCTAFFWRFLRLAAVQLVVYAGLFAALHPLLFQRLYPILTREVAGERTAFFIRASLYVAFGALLAGAATVFDYAKVRTVVEGRRGMLGAVGAALGFLQRHFGQVVTLFLANAALFAAVTGLYGIAAPEAGGAGLRLWLGFAVSQVYVLGRLWVKLVFWASETALVQSRVHPGA